MPEELIIEIGDPPTLETIQRIHGGDHTELEKVLAYSRGFLMKSRNAFIDYKLVTHDNFEDLVHDVCERVIRTLTGDLGGCFDGRGEGTYQTWLYGLAIRKKIDWARRKKGTHRRAEVTAAEMSEDTSFIAGLILDQQPDPSASMEHRESLAILSETISECIMKTPESLRSYLTQGLFGTRSITEMEKELGVSIGYLQVRISRLRKKIREKLMKRIKDDPGFLAYLLEKGIRIED